jgi:hypothetical protein
MFENKFKQYISNTQFNQILANHNLWLYERSEGKEKLETQEEVNEAVAMHLASTRYLPGREVPTDIDQYIYKFH